MKKYEFNSINRIAEVFEEHEVKFHVINMHGQEEVLAGFSVDNGPKVIMKFISRDNDNDVAARIFGLVSNTPREKHPRVLETCNILGKKVFIPYVELDDAVRYEGWMEVNRDRFNTVWRAE